MMMAESDEEAEHAVSQLQEAISNPTIDALEAAIETIKGLEQCGHERYDDDDLEEAEDLLAEVRGVG